MVKIHISKITKLKSGIPTTNSTAKKTIKVMMWWIPSTFKAMRLPIRIEIKIYAAPVLYTVAATDAIAHKMPKNVEKTKSCFSSYKSSEYFMKKPDRIKRTARTT